VRHGSRSTHTFAVHPGSGPSVLSSNGQWVLFSSAATNLVPGVTPGAPGANNLFRKNLATGAVDLAVPTSGVPDGSSTPGGISDDGNIIAFSSAATNIIGGGGNANHYSYLRNLPTASIQPLTYLFPGETLPSNGNVPQLSADGRTVAFSAGHGFSANGYTTVVVCANSAGLSCRTVPTPDYVFNLHLAANGSAVEFSGAKQDAPPWEVFRTDLSTDLTSSGSVNNAGESANRDTGNFGNALARPRGHGTATEIRAQRAVTHQGRA
jgi:hypothetical protein